MTTIITKFGVGAPTRNDLEIAELAVDATTGDLYTKLGDTSVVKVNGSSVYNDAGIKADLAAETQDRVDGDAALQGQIDDLDLSGAIEEAPEDGKQYARQDAAWAEIQAAGGGNGNPVVISDNPPASPEEGDLWYSSKAGDEGLYCWDGEVWFEAGGANGADGQDGQDGKQIWSETTPDGDIYYDKGNVSVSGSFTAGGPVIAQSQMVVSAAAVYRAKADISNGGNGLYFNGNAVLPADATGVSDTEGRFTLGTSQRQWKHVHGIDATFSGTVNANNFFRPTKAGLAFAENVVAPVDKDFSSTSQKVNLGAPTNKWKDGHFAGTVNSTRMTQGGSPVIDAKGLINTLSTLRNATKDETTLKGMRDALADAIGGLIENLEHEIAVTMEISK
jgi:hypothetical protein